MIVTRELLMQSWNTRFYFVLGSAAHVYEQHGTDVYDAMVKMLEHFALHDLELPRKESLNVLYMTSLDPLGDWVSMPTGPAYRQSKPIVKQILMEACVYHHGCSGAEYLLEEVDVSFMDKVST